MIRVVPAVLTNNPELAIEQITSVDGLVERISVDIVDGRFAQNKTIDPLILADHTFQTKLDFQLMVYEPVNWIDKCMMANADRIIGHIEYMANQKDFVLAVKEKGAKAGFGLDLDTPVEKISPDILAHIDVLLLMSVKAGFSSQKFEESTYKKVTEAMQLRLMHNLSFAIQIDGGVNKEIARVLDNMGVEEVSMTSKIFQGVASYNLNEINTYLSGS